MFRESWNDQRQLTTAEISDNGTEIIDDTAVIHESDPMLKSVLNGDWSTSVPGKQFPKLHTVLSCGLHFISDLIKMNNVRGLYIYSHLN